MTQAVDVFRTMTDEELHALVKDMRDHLRPLYRQLEGAAAATLRLRPVYLGKQPFEKRCAMIRKAFSLRVNADAAAEILPAFFLERFAKEVVELLDLLGVKHEEGVLKEPSPAPPKDAALRKAVEKFRGGENPVMRGLLLKTFASQAAIDWPALDALLFPAEHVRSGS
jgi:hypothetical protein